MILVLFFALVSSQLDFDGVEKADVKWKKRNTHNSTHIRIRMILKFEDETKRKIQGDDIMLPFSFALSL